MAENLTDIPKKPRPRLTAILAGLAKLTLIAAGICLLAALFLFVLWWRLIDWPQRRKTPRERAVAQREALLELVGAAGVLLASRSTPK